MFESGKSSASGNYAAVGADQGNDSTKMVCAAGTWSATGFSDSNTTCDSCSDDNHSTGANANSATECVCDSLYHWNATTGKCEITVIIGTLNLIYAPKYSVLLTTSSSCPSGYTDYGIIGILSNNSNSLSLYSAFGSAYNSSWTWSHPRLCYVAATATSSSTLNSITFASSTCPSASYTAVGQTGVIWTNPYTQIYTQGGTYNSSWTWTHPIICFNNDASAVPVGAIALAPSAADCPTGYTVKGQIGLIHAKTATCAPFASGADLSVGSTWQWCHPIICTKN